MVKKGILCGVALSACVATAHENWVDADTFYPETGRTVSVHLCSGHYFPKSSFAVKDKVLDAFTVQGPDGTPVAIATTAQAKQRTGTLAMNAAGIHVISFTLKRPRAKHASFEGKALLVAGNTADDTTRYALGHGLELIPGKPVSTLKPGDELPVALHLDGTPLAGMLSISVAGGKTSSLRTEPDQPASVKLHKAGRYLVTTSHEGRGCSLVFMVKDASARATKGR